MKTTWFMVQTGRGLYYDDEADWFACADEAKRMSLPDAKRLCEHARKTMARCGEDVRRFPRVVKATLEIVAARNIK